MVGGDHGSLTKEPALAKLDATIRAITPGMPYRDLLAFVREDAGATTDDEQLLRLHRFGFTVAATGAYDCTSPNAFHIGKPTARPSAST